MPEASEARLQPYTTVLGYFHREVPEVQSAICYKGQPVQQSISIRNRPLRTYTSLQAFGA
eukprot:5365993-Alexandrium_andersonii.AAC.1